MSDKIEHVAVWCGLGIGTLVSSPLFVAAFILDNTSVRTLCGVFGCVALFVGSVFAAYGIDHFVRGKQ